MKYNNTTHIQNALTSEVKNNDAKTEKCKCTCHNEGVTIIHITPCCDNGIVYKKNNN